MTKKKKKDIMAKKRKLPPPEPCLCGEGTIVEPWPCCEQCRVGHFRWPTAEQVLAKGGAVVDYAKAAKAMGAKRGFAKIEIKVSAEPAKHPNRVFVAWRASGTKRWTKLGDHTELSLASLMDLKVDRNMLYWWIQNLAGTIEELADLDPLGP